MNIRLEVFLDEVAICQQTDTQTLGKTEPPWWR